MTSSGAPGSWFGVGFILEYEGFERGDVGFILNVPNGKVDIQALRIAAAAPDLLAALKDSIGALEFSQDYHRDLGNEDQAFVADKLDAALAAIAKAEGRAPTTPLQDENVSQGIREERGS